VPIDRSPSRTAVAVSRPRRMAALAAVVVLASLAAAPAVAAQGSKGATPGAAAQGPGGRMAHLPRADPAKRMWWNREQVAARLALSDEQRKAMDERFTTCIEQRREHTARYAQLRKAMGEALVAGDWKTAEARAQAADAELAAASSLETALVVEVMKVLSDSQRHQLVDAYPRLLQRPWLVGGFRGR